MAKPNEQLGEGRAGPQEETVVIRRPEIKETRGLVDTFKQNWRDLSDVVGQKGEQVKAFLSSLGRLEKAAPKSAKNIHEETTQILQPTADAVRGRRDVQFPTEEEVKVLQEAAKVKEEEKRRAEGLKAITEESSMIDLQEFNGTTVESFTDTAGYRFKEVPEQRENQDVVLANNSGIVVADGMGGGASGKEAAEIVGKSFMDGLKAVKTADENKFKNAMAVSARHAKEALKTLGGKEMTGAAVLASKIVEDLPDGGKKLAVAWSGDVWGAVVKADGTVDLKRQTQDHSLYSAIEEVRAEKNEGKKGVLFEKLVRNLAQADTSDIPLEKKEAFIAKGIIGTINAQEDAYQKSIPQLRKTMFYSINNAQEQIHIDSKIFELSPGESFIQLTDGYTDVLNMPQDLEKAVRIAKETKRPVMQVLTQLYTEALSKGGKAKEDNIGGTYMTVEIPEITGADLEEEVSDWDEKTQPDIKMPNFDEERTNPRIQLPRAG